jgi:hypothetical protein
MKTRPQGSFARAISRIREGLGEARCGEIVGKSPALLRKWCDPDNDSLPNLHQAVELDIAYVRSGLGEPPILLAHSDQVWQSTQQAREVLDLVRFMITMQSIFAHLAQSVAQAVDALESPRDPLASAQKREILAFIEKLDAQVKRLQRSVNLAGP